MPHAKAEQGLASATAYDASRWTVPELCGFNGLAVYLDSNTLLLDDINELAKTPMATAVMLRSAADASVMLMNCSAFRNWSAWPRMAAIGENGWDQAKYVELLGRRRMLSRLPVLWSCVDGEGFDEIRTSLLSFTCMETPTSPDLGQIYRDRQMSPCGRALRLWSRYARQHEQGTGAEVDQ